MDTLLLAALERQHSRCRTRIWATEQNGVIRVLFVCDSCPLPWKLTTTP